MGFGYFLMAALTVSHGWLEETQPPALVAVCSSQINLILELVQILDPWSPATRV